MENNTNATSKSNILAWHYHLQDLMLGESCSYKLSERVLTVHINPGETEEVMVSFSSKNASGSGVLTESMRMESTPCSKSLTSGSKIEQPPHSASSGEWMRVDTLSVNLGKCVLEQQNILPSRCK